jgi:tetratricopeptide (TPR) repeat protein
MIRIIRRLAYAVTFMAGSVGSAAHAEWLEGTSKHFVILGNASESELRDRAKRLEQYDAMLRMLFQAPETTQVHLFLLDTMGDVQSLAGSSSVAGFYSPSAQMSVAFMPRRILENYGPGFTAERVLFHEYAHHMLLSSTNAFVPGWVTEGLAELFMSAMIKPDGSVIVGAPNESRGWAMMSQNRWSVAEMIAKDNQKVSGDEVIERYTRGWALLHYLWLSGQRKGQYVAFIKDLNETGDANAAARKAFGDLDKLNSEVNAYLNRHSLPTSQFTADKMKADTDVTVRKLSPGEVAMIGKRMQSARGVNEKTSGALYTQAKPIADAYVADPVVQTWFAEIAYDAKQYPAADAAADRALAVDPKSLMAIVFKGRIAAQAAMKSQSDADWKTARAWFLKANRVNPDHPLPFVLFYDSFTAAGQVPPESAVTGLYRAVMLVPQDLDLRSRAAIALIRANDLPRARSILAAAAFYPHSRPDNPMAKLIAFIDEGKDSKAVLERAGELRLAGQNEFTAPPPDDSEDEPGDRPKGDDKKGGDKKTGADKKSK